ncbi:MAG: hypothetical protein JWM34_5095 [Ilumatobacteraceae bacterium]|nr:hypothetical protein [Ilumatobacteraceae bacterium]
MPTVSLVCEGFERQARATGRGLGFDGLALAVMRGHVDAQSSEEMLTSFLEHTFQQVVDGLTRPLDIGMAAIAEPSALDTAVSGSIDEVNRAFGERGWTDGLPIVPPTRARVEAYIAPTGHDPWRTLGIARPSGRDITVWSIAVNAVMVGCEPAHLPVLLAIAEVLIDPHYGVEHSGNTTGADALVVLNGSVIDDLGFNHGPGALREGAHANTSVARWLRMFLRNVCGFTSDEHDKATFGNSARVVLAEDEAALREIGWSSLCADFGHRSGDDVVTIGRINSGIIIGSVVGSTPAEIIPYLADGLVRVSGWDLVHLAGLGHGHYRPLLVLSPLLARTFARAGWSKDDVRTALYEHARLPAWKFEALIGDWSNLAPGRPTLVELVAGGHAPTDFAVSDDPERMVPIVAAPSGLLIAVAGDPGRANAYAMSHDGPHGNWTSAAVDRSYSPDLVCRIDNREACS